MKWFGSTRNHSSDFTTSLHGRIGPAPALNSKAILLLLRLPLQQRLGRFPCINFWPLGVNRSNQMCKSHGETGNMIYKWWVNITSMLVYRRLTFDGAFLRTVDISRGNHGIPNWAWEFLSQTWAAFKTRHYNDCGKMFIGNPSSSMTLPKKKPYYHQPRKVTYHLSNCISRMFHCVFSPIHDLDICLCSCCFPGRLRHLEEGGSGCCQAGVGPPAQRASEEHHGDFW